MKLHILLSVSGCLVGGAVAHAQAQSGPSASSAPPVAAVAPASPSTPAAPPEDPAVAATPPEATATSEASIPAVTPVPSTPMLEPPASVPAPDRVVSQFLSLGRQDGVSRIGAELGFVSVDTSDGADDLTPLRIGLFGQYVAPAGFGGYGALNIARVSGEGESATGLSDLELGGIFSGKLGTIEGVARFGVALPTASDDDLGDVLSNILGAYSRIDDMVLALPNTSWIRISGSPVIRRQGVTVRADFGADIPVAAEDGFDPDPVLHLNLAGGLVAGQHQASLELVNLFFMGDETERISSIGGSYRFDLGTATPYFGLFKPFGSDGDFDNLTLTLLAGVSGTIDPS